MPAELNGDFVLYEGLKASTLHLVTGSGGALTESKLGGFNVTGSFKANTGRLTFSFTQKSKGRTRIRWTYQGYPVNHVAGYRGGRQRFWGWAGYRSAVLTGGEPVIGSTQQQTAGWWARPRTSYAEDIQPLFRDLDIGAMRSFGVLLDSLDYLRDNARSVYDAVAYPSPSFVMPCDGAWPKEWTTLFKYWMDDGRPS